ncbi:MAG: PilN domain-containing protein [Dehalococcoidales bacterium]|nr:PilN domain-containing protein [Dehalococcoidales bacterium]
MANNKVTLYIDATSLRLMASHGRRIKQWASSPLEPGLIKNNVIIDEIGVSVKIQQLFKVQRIKTKRILVGISGLHCLSRPVVLPPLPSEVLNEVVTREAKRLLPVPLEKFYMSWQSIPAPVGKTQVFLAAVPRNTVDSLFKTLRRAGLYPSFLGLKPLLLTKLATVATGIIVDVQKSEFDVVIMSEGIPQPVRTISFANAELTWSEKMPIIMNDIVKTITFFNTNNPPEKTLAADVPIFVSGELTDEPELCQTLSQETGHTVTPLLSPLEYSDERIPGQYMANISLASRGIVSGGKSYPSPININALPSKYKPKGISLVNVIGLPLIAILASGIIVLLILIQNVSANITSTQTNLAAAEQLLKQRTSQRIVLTNNITRLEKQLSDNKVKLSQFTAAGASLDQQTTGLNRDLTITLTALPKSIILKSIAHADNLLTVAGQAPNEKEILTYVRNLSGSGIFADITVTSIIRNIDGTMDFNLLGNHEGQKIAASNFEAMITYLPLDVSLLQMDYNKGSMTIKAIIPEQDSILPYIKLLEESHRFKDIIIAPMTRVDTDELEFTLILETGE